MWLFAIFVLAIGVGGARDFLLILLQDQDYLHTQFTEDGIAYFADYPLVLRIVWAVNIAGLLLAPIALLFRARWTVPIAIAAAASQAVLLPITFIVRDRWNALGDWYSAFDIGIGVLGIVFAVYCWWMLKRRDLRD